MGQTVGKGGHLSLLCRDCGETNHFLASDLEHATFCNCASCGLALNLTSLKGQASVVRLAQKRRLPGTLGGVPAISRVRH